MKYKKYINQSYMLLDPVGSAITSAGSVLGSLIGGIFGKKANDKTNETNLQIARETNQANRANQEYQNEWNLEQWNRTNEYNTPESQRARLEAAGLNPIFYGLDGTGNAQALTSAPFTAIPGFPMTNSGAFLAEGIGNAVSKGADVYAKMMEAGKIKEDTENARINNEILKASKDSIIESKFWGCKLLEGQWSDLLPAQVNQLRELADSYGKGLDIARQELDVKRGQLELDELKTYLSGYFESLKISQEQQRILIDGYLGLAAAIRDGKRVVFEGQVAGAKVKFYDQLARGHKYQNDYNEVLYPVYNPDGTVSDYMQQRQEILGNYNRGERDASQFYADFENHKLYYLKADFIDAYKANLMNAKAIEAFNHYQAEMAKKQNHRYWWTSGVQAFKGALDSAVGLMEIGAPFMTPARPVIGFGR